jgi:hypothetical protein
MTGFPDASQAGNRKPVDPGEQRGNLDSSARSKTHDQGGTMHKRKTMRTAAALALAIGTMTAIGAGQAQAAPQATSHGCPSGYVCFYPGAGWNGDRPSHKFLAYGAHNLSDVVGTYRVYNNQTGNAWVRTCTGYNGTGCEGYMYPGWWIDKNMTPINSIVLGQ